MADPDNILPVSSDAKSRQGKEVPGMADVRTEPTKTLTASKFGSAKFDPAKTSILNSMPAALQREVRNRVDDLESALQDAKTLEEKTLKQSFTQQVNNAVVEHNKKNPNDPIPLRQVNGQHDPRYLELEQKMFNEEVLKYAREAQEKAEKAKVEAEKKEEKTELAGDEPDEKNLGPSFAHRLFSGARKALSATKETALLPASVLAGVAGFLESHAHRDLDAQGGPPTKANAIEFKAMIRAAEVFVAAVQMLDILDDILKAIITHCSNGDPKKEKLYTEYAKATPEKRKEIIPDQPEQSFTDKLKAEAEEQNRLALIASGDDPGTARDESQVR